MALDILIKNVAVWGSDGLRDLAVAGGRFVAVPQNAAEISALVLDASGKPVAALGSPVQWVFDRTAGSGLTDVFAGSGTAMCRYVRRHVFRYGVGRA